ncbi:hypothetical protein SADUNF_Sadunf11G0066200 [Salix dunnii]|uniref:VQ domain-containing protein n=1 Tax=Salix dunnii TaxID=1413687 RepID=A0A835JKK2_9ROSI|nr:hypothetical protein SADUNF_Sadunf11G0066200 [Salix dunnii]
MCQLNLLVTCMRYDWFLNGALRQFKTASGQLVSSLYLLASQIPYLPSVYSSLNHFKELYQFRSTPVFEQSKILIYLLDWIVMAGLAREPVKVVIIDTEFVHADESSFMTVVQKLTGKDSAPSGNRHELKRGVSGKSASMDQVRGKRVRVDVDDSGDPVLKRDLSFQEFEILAQRDAIALWVVSASSGRTMVKSKKKLLQIHDAQDDGPRLSPWDTLSLPLVVQAVVLGRSTPPSRRPVSSALAKALSAETLASPQGISVLSASFALAQRSPRPGKAKRVVSPTCPAEATDEVNPALSLSDLCPPDAMAPTRENDLVGTAPPTLPPLLESSRQYRTRSKGLIPLPNPGIDKSAARFAEAYQSRYCTHSLASLVGLLLTADGSLFP